MNDFLGNELYEDDDVVFCRPYYSSLVKGKVVKITKTGAKIKYTSKSGEEEELFRKNTQIISVSYWQEFEEDYNSLLKSITE